MSRACSGTTRNWTPVDPSSPAPCWPLLKLRTRAQRLFKLSDEHTMLLWTTLAGLVGAAATVVFRVGIDWLEPLVDPDAIGLVQIARDLPWYARLALPSVGGAAAGITSAYSTPIAGALFVTEIVLGSIAMERFGPIIVSSVGLADGCRPCPGGSHWAARW